jgi:hypothetical protein
MTTRVLLPIPWHFDDRNSPLVFGMDSTQWLLIGFTPGEPSESSFCVGEYCGIYSRYRERLLTYRPVQAGYDYKVHRVYNLGGIR